MPEQNPENPYVLNPLYFLNTTHVYYNQTLMAYMHKWNSYLASLFGLFSCSLVLYLVLNKTPRHFKTYSKVILLCTCVDLYFLFIESLAQFRFRVSGGALMFCINGPLSQFSYWAQCKLISLYAASYAGIYLMLPFQYVYRFLTIKNKEPPSVFLLSIFLLSGILVVVGSLFTAHFGFCWENNGEQREYAMNWYAEVPVPQVIYGLATSPFFCLHTAAFTLLGMFCYTSALIFAKKTVGMLRRQAFQMSRKTFTMQRQFGRALFAQAMIPLCCAMFPVLVAFMIGHFKTEIGYGSEYIIMSISWFPFLNSVSNLVFISPYRNFCLYPLKKMKSLVATQSVSVVSSTNDGTRNYRI